MRIFDKVKKWFQYKTDYGMKFTFQFLVLYRFKKDILYKHNIILKYLERKYASVIDKYKKSNSTYDVLQPDCPIWICWFQGEDNMPTIVKSCIASIKNHCASHPIYIITYDNVLDYISVPQYILEKVRTGKISLTHYSDIIRSKLLTVHGGIWLDATLYLTDELKVFNLPLFTLKNDVPDDYFYISRYRWTSFCLGGVKNNVLSSFLSDFFDEYHKNQSTLIDYFLIDYILDIGYRHVASIKKMIDDIPVSNPHIFFLINNYLNDYNEQEFLKIKEDTNIFKLTWKSEHKTDFLKKSYYYKIINNLI